MLIKCMRASRRRGLIVIVESKKASVATLQPLKHVLRNPVRLIGCGWKTVAFESSESGARDVSQLSETAD